MDGDGYGRPATLSYPDGSWSRTYYDAQGRRSQIIRSFKNSPFDSSANSARSTTYSYVPVDSRDVPTADDSRPRVTEEKILGITTAKAYHAYYKDNGQYVEVTETCATGDAAFGATGNLRTEKRFYPATANAASAGRLQTVTYPDGRMETYTYEYGTYAQNADPAQCSFSPGSGAALRISVVHGTVASPNGIANKTIRVVTIRNAYGDKVMTEQYAYTGSGFARIDWTVITYDGEHHLLHAYASNGTQISNTWNCCNKESETLADGTQYTYTYDDLKRLVTKTKLGCGSQPAMVTSYTYDASNRWLSVTVAAGNLSLTRSREFNPAGQVIKKTDAQGRVTSYTYLNGINTGSGVKGASQTTIHPGGFKEISENYCDGSPLSVSGEAVVAQYHDYGINSDGSRWSKTVIGSSNSPRWQKSTSNVLGQAIKQERSGYNGTVVAQNFYNAKGQRVKTSTTGNADTLYVYDDLGNPIRVGFDVDGNGALDLAGMDRVRETNTVLTQDNGVWWQVRSGKVYGTNNSDTATVTGIQKKRLTGFSGNIVNEIQSIDISGNVTATVTSVDRTAKTLTQTITYPSSTVAEQSITVNGLPSSRRSSTNLTYTYSYDGLGRNITVTDPRTGNASTHYDAKNRVDYTEDAAGNKTYFGYDDATGRRLWTKNALNKYAYFAYDVRGKLTRTWGDTDYPTENVYDQYGQLTQLKTYRGGTGWNGASWPADPGTADVTTWTYDPASGLNTVKNYADGKSTAYTYSIDGKPITRIWARLNNGQPLVTTYAYNAATGELTGVTYSDTTPALALTYNRLGQQKTVTDAVGSRTFAYSSSLQLTSETIDGIYSKTLTRSYSNNGFMGRYTGLNIGTEYSVGYGYDGYGRPNQVTSGADVFSYAYLANSNLVGSITRPGNLSTAFSFEANRNLITGVENKYGATTVSAYGYANDAIGRRTSMSRSGTAFTQADAITYTYNDRSEVTGATSNNLSTYDYGFNFDNIGNRLTSRLVQNTTSYTANNVNQYTSITTPQGATLPTYDDDGNMLTNLDGWAYTWNGENRLISATNATTRLEFSYDYMGRRVEKKVYTGSSDNWTPNKIERFVYDGFKLIEKLDGNTSNAIVQKFTWQPDAVGLDIPLTVFDTAAGASYYYLADVNKNIGQLLDASGNLVAKYEYSPFGKITTQSGSYAAANPFRFSSEYYDDKTGLVYYNYRYYSPEMGRWTKRDPISEIGGINLYVIIGNLLINKIDKNGLFDEYSMPGSPGLPNVLPPYWTGPDENDPRLSLDDLLNYLNTYNNMKKANTKGSDKYFHCLSHCDLARSTSPEYAKKMGNWREFSDNLSNYIKSGLAGKVSQELRDGLKDSQSDIAANMAGINCDCNKTCSECCTDYGKSDNPDKPGNPIVPKKSMEYLKSLGY